MSIGILSVQGHSIEQPGLFVKLKAIAFKTKKYLQFKLYSL